MERHERIAKAITASGKKKGEIATECGVANSAVTQWISGESKSLRPENLYALAKATGFRAEWLAIGEGPETDSSEPSNVALAMQPKMSYRYPVISWVAAGAWAEAVEPFPPGFSDRYEISDYNSKGVAFWLEVKGDSMTAPVGTSITEGMMILVDTEAEAISGKLVVAKLSDSNEATFKKLVEDGGRRFLKPLNPAYPVEMCAENCRIVGVVVRAMMKL
ncbi:helix-turn-helix domain-containing protein [Pseudomonas alkylphenolica]|jgi:SOS-response transcriptional repressor LexA|uniref:Helix-turn-helix domain-containing protein n=1 Tax=Pseudomonas alkylphenolica TaxID=237609 RepID=A0A6I6GTE4_9PSED|nr:XRE family transcriptional regulator [Pseudomonas alkylphenolica]QGW77773.1 helix-turn-helix domain-containing protein [Pseudomonas alkylphenolica]